MEGSNDFDGDGIANFLDKDSVSFIAEGERVRRLVIGRAVSYTVKQPAHTGHFL